MKISLKFRFLLNGETSFTSRNTLEYGRKLFPQKVGFHNQEQKIPLKIGFYFMGRTEAQLSLARYTEKWIKMISTSKKIVFL